MASPEQLAAMSDFRSYISKTVISYFRITDYLTVRIEQVLGSAVHDFDDEFDFWSRVLLLTHGNYLRESVAHGIRDFRPQRDIARLRKKRLKHGDQARLKSWYVSDWIPRLPGELAKQDMILRTDWSSHWPSSRFLNNQIPSEARNFIESACTAHPDGLVLGAGLPTYDWFGKAALMLAGIGSVRLPLNPHDADRYACLSAVTGVNYFTDIGIPVVVSEQVYREFDRARENRSVAVEADLRGRLMFGHIPDPFTHMPLARGEIASPRVEAVLRTSTDIPIAYIHVTSPLDCDFRTHDTHPKCNAWTLFRCEETELSEKQDPRLSDILSGLGSYGLTFKPFQPDEPGDIERAVEFLKSSPRWLNLTRRPSPFGFGGPFKSLVDAWKKPRVELLTDFDGMVPRITNSELSLSQIQLAAKPALFMDRIRDEMRRFDEAVLALAETDCARTVFECLHDYSYGYIQLNGFASGRDQTAISCRSCGTKTSVAERAMGSSWCNGVIGTLHTRGWKLLPGGYICGQCATTTEDVERLSESDMALFAKLLVAATDNTGYRGWATPLPHQLACQRCDAALRIKFSDHMVFAEQWANGALQAFVEDGWAFDSGRAICRQCLKQVCGG